MSSSIGKLIRLQRLMEVQASITTAIRRMFRGSQLALQELQAALLAKG